MSADDAREDVKSIVTPSRVEYQYTPGLAASRFLRGVEQGKLIGGQCPSCEKVYVPPRGACPRCGVATSKQLEVSDQGTVVTYSVIRVPSANIDLELPYVAAQVLLDGAHISFHTLLQEVELDEVRMGMRVQAVWAPKEEWGTTIKNIKYFKPIDEPDMPFESYQEYL